jgi:exodeoxyribonuclease V beta subunit
MSMRPAESTHVTAEPPRAASPALALPLAGAHVIEASAGSGKTWTLAVLFARLVIEAGLRCEQILLMTFTRAATAELRERVFGLLQALAQQPDAGAACTDRTVRAVLDAARRAGIAEHQIAQRLRQALLEVDDAAISTIHGFYQRVLAEHALAAGDLLQAELSTDVSDALLELAQEFWHARVSGAPELRTLRSAERIALAQLLMPAGSALHSPQRLADWAAFYLPQQGLQLQGPAGGAQAAAHATGAMARLAQARAALRAAFDAKRVREIVTVDKAIDHGIYRAKTQSAHVDDIERWLATDGALLPPGPWLLTHYVPSKLAAATRKGCTTPAHPFFDAVQSYADAHQALKPACDAWRAQLKREFFELLRQQLPQRLAVDGQRSTDAIVRQLAGLLDGAGGERIAHSLHRRHAAVLVDEFQDTDILQWHLLQRVFTGRDGTFFVVVGDPKQSIYRFRGADIQGYLAASEQLPNRHALTENYRSEPSLITALNTLFAGPGADFGDPRIRYAEVSPGARERPALTVPSGAAFEVVRVEGEGDRKELAARAAAARIAALLSCGARLGERALRPSDIAVLTQSNEQAADIKRALQAAGVAASTRLRESVFATFEALQLAWLLDALANPDDRGALHLALLSPLIGATVQELAALIEQPSAALAERARWQQWAAAADRLGVMAAVQRIAQERRTYERWAALPDGERKITNLRHLLELMQAQQLRDAGALDTLRVWLLEQRHGTATADEALLRLESDGDTVHVLTVHRSKGLEFPVVVLPFLWQARRDRSDEELMLSTRDGALLDFGPQFSDTARAQAQAERDGEAMRQAYVALTRAVHRCIVVWCDHDRAGDSPLGRLLGGRDWALLERDSHGSITCIADEKSNLSLTTQQSKSLPELPAVHLPAAPWRVTSYSSWLRGIADEPALDRPDHDRLATQAAPPSAGGDARFAFPAGANAGECLHAILEAIDFGAGPAQWRPVVAAALARHGIAALHLDGTLDWLAEVMRTPLGGGVPCLAALAGTSAQREWEFHLPASAVAASALRDALRAAGIDAAPAPVPAGFFRGFIDLVFTHGGRYYIADYKSNRLGGAIGDYAPARLQEAMQAERYDLQALLYQFALHRHLRRRLRGYDPQRHLGGAFFLFLRGMRGEAAGGVWHRAYAPRELEALEPVFALPHAAAERTA